MRLMHVIAYINCVHPLQYNMHNLHVETVYAFKKSYKLCRGHVPFRKLEIIY